MSLKRYSFFSAYVHTSFILMFVALFILAFVLYGWCFPFIDKFMLRHKFALILMAIFGIIFLREGVIFMGMFP